MKTLNYIVCALLLIFLMSCNSGKKHTALPIVDPVTKYKIEPLVPPDSAKITTTINVYIGYTDQEPYEPIVLLSNNGDVRVMRNSYVQWNIIGPKLRINEIAPKPNNSNIWQEIPEPKNANIWRGLVLDEGGISQEYYVKYEININGTWTPDIIDPVIEINP